jgi:hypothetical protein
VDEPWRSGEPVPSAGYQPPTPSTAYQPPTPSAAYEPPPAFAPPALRGAPMNETQVLGRTSYPQGPYQPMPADPVPHQPVPAGSFPYQPMPADPVPHQPVPAGPVPYQPVPAGSLTYQPGQYPPLAPRPARQGAAARRRRIVSVATGTGVVVALVAIVAVLIDGSGAKRAPRSLSLPGSVDDYSLIHTIDGLQLASLFSPGSGTFASVPANDLAAAKVAVYSERDQSLPGVVFLGFTAAESPSIGAQLHSEPADYVATGMLGGAGSPGRPQRVDAGPLGGALRCAELDLDGEPTPAGVWADHDTLGIVLIVNVTAGMTTAQVGALTRDFRAQTEH